jgi:hypothetical protein
MLHTSRRRDGPSETVPVDTPQRSPFRMAGSITGPIRAGTQSSPTPFGPVRSARAARQITAHLCHFMSRSAPGAAPSATSEACVSPRNVLDDHSGSRSRSSNHLHHAGVFAQDSRKKGRSGRRQGPRIGNGCDEGRVGAGGGPTAMIWGRPRSDDQCRRPACHCGIHSSR